MKFAYIRQHGNVLDVSVMCAVFGITPAGFYAWCSRPDSARYRELLEQYEITASMSHVGNC